MESSGTRSKKTILLRSQSTLSMMARWGVLLYMTCHGTFLPASACVIFRSHILRCSSAFFTDLCFLSIAPGCLPPLKWRMIRFDCAVRWRTGSVGSSGRLKSLRSSSNDIATMSDMKKSGKIVSRTIFIVLVILMHNFKLLLENRHDVGFVCFNRFPKLTKSSQVLRQPVWVSVYNGHVEFFFCS